MAEIIPITKSINTYYIIREKGVILVDAGWKGCSRAFSSVLKQNNIAPEEIRLIIPTHGDFDHAGGAGELKALTGASLVLHEKDLEIVEEGKFHWPRGVTAWGKISRAMMLPFLKYMVTPPATQVDLVLNDHGLSLKEYGINGEIIHTPGHTYGSVSVVLESGEAFVGCLAHNRFPFVMKPGLPIYALDIELLKQSWKKILDKGARTIYPGHGKPFSVEKVSRFLP